MRNSNRETTFRFKQFSVSNSISAMKVGTDGVLLGAACDIPGGIDTPRILDIGTGTGVIALMLAQRYPQACIDAIEIDGNACVEAARNFEGSPWSSRLNLVECDALEFKTATRYDLIVSNPPFFNNGPQSADKSRATARHNSTLPFDGLFECAALVLADTGVFFTITPADVFDELRAVSVSAGLHLVNEIRIFPTPVKPCRRVISGWTKKIGECLTENLTIQTSPNCYSQAYINLTKDFYLNF